MQGAFMINCVCEDVHLLKKTIARDLDCIARRILSNI